MKKSTVIIGSVIGTAVAAWQVPAVQSAVTPILASHPSVSAIISAGVALWLLLHKPTPTS